MDTVFISSIDHWLRLPDDKCVTSPFQRWLQYQDRPATTPYEYPFEWILEALGREFDRAKARIRVIRCVVDILIHRPDRALAEPPEARAYEQLEALLFNTFCLCAELQAPLQFGPILQEIWRDDLVRGNWRGFDLQEELIRAVRMNQYGPELWQEWFAPLDAGRPNGLASDPIRAAIGVAWMPESEKSIGKPWIAELIRAVGLAASRLEEIYTDPALRRSNFDFLLGAVKEPYLVDLDWDLARGAMMEQWPIWSSLRLNLFVSRDLVNGNKRVLVSKYLAELLTTRHEATDLTPVSSMPGIVRELDVCPEGYAFLAKVARPFEKLRRKNPFVGERSMMATLLAVLQEVDRNSRPNPSAASARASIFGKLCVAAVQTYPEEEGKLREDLQRVAHGEVHLASAETRIASGVDSNTIHLAADTDQNPAELATDSDVNSANLPAAGDLNPTEYAAKGLKALAELSEAA